MAMTLRADKGAILSWNEMDANFRACMGVHNLLHVQDQKPVGTHGGTFSSGAWRTRDLNTVLVNKIVGASLVNNQITLPAGTYFASAYASAYYCNIHKAMLYNVTESVQILAGSNEMLNTGNTVAAVSKSMIYGLFYTYSVNTIELQHRTNVGRATDGFGIASSLITEIYSDIKIWKLA